LFIGTPIFGAVSGPGEQAVVSPATAASPEVNARQEDRTGDLTT
jgi:hypothetical protein